MDRPPGVDYDKAPFLLIWEATQACGLACRHCRAGAIDRRDPEELTFEEAGRLIDDTAEMGTPIFVFSGGDPLQRDDLEDLVRRAKGRGMRVGAIPAATPRLTRARVESLKEAGLDQMALSLDGPDEARHDGFRQVAGSFARTMEGARYAREAGLPLQINTVFGAWNAEEFDAIAARVDSLGVVFWEVFFLVPMGRGALLQGVGAEEYERLFQKLYDLQARAPYIIKVAEAPHYRRYVVERGRAERAAGGAGPGAHARLARPAGPHGSVGQAPKGVNSGKGFCFVSHRGEVCPSGFLPIVAGNVRERSVIDLYRDSPIFRSLRDSARLQGICGGCAFHELCGGSRARAYALTGDPFAEDPDCRYETAGRAAPSARRGPNAGPDLRPH